VFLAKQHQVNVVLSPSALKTLLDNPGPNFDKEWDIPVIVKSFPITGTILNIQYLVLCYSYICLLLMS